MYIYIGYRKIYYFIKRKFYIIIIYFYKTYARKENEEEKENEKKDREGTSLISLSYYNIKYKIRIRNKIKNVI